MGCGGSSAADAAQPVQTPGLQFAWPQSGDILIKTVKFRAEYDPRNKELNVRLSEKKLTESRLVWNSGQFTLEDVRTIDTISGQISPGLGVKLQFFITSDGKFRDMLSTQRVLEQLAAAQKVYLSPEHVRHATDKLVGEMRKQWSRWVEFWITPHASSGSVQSCGRSCLKLSSTKDHNADIASFLAKKFGSQVSNVVMAETSNSVAAIIERLGLRPHTVKMRSYRYLCLDVGGAPIREMWEETGFTVFCWPDIPELSSEQYIRGEMDRLTSGVNKIVEAMHQRMSYLHNTEP